jgi:membrane-associated protease RseP (regulator of RpoE activity)
MVLPTVTGIEYPQFAIGVPFWYWIIGIFTVLMAHEPMHGLLARVEKIPIKSFGLLLFVVMPGAFVEPDEKQVKKLPMLKKMRIYAAGSFGNIILATILALILFLGLDPVFFRGAVAYGYQNFTDYNLTEPFPVEELNMTGVILSIDGINVENIEDLRKVMEGKIPGQTILIETTKDEYELTLTKDPTNETRGYMGIFVLDTRVLKEEYRDDQTLSPVLSSSTELLIWVLMLNYGIGAANLLPIKPLDGGLMFEEIMKKIFKKEWAVKVVKIISLFTLLLILITIFGPTVIKFLR